MKKRLHDKKAGIAILSILFIISLAEIILRATVFSDILSTISNYGEALITAVFSALLLSFALKGKDRIFYILCGAWLAFFVINQLYDLPGMIKTVFELIGAANSAGVIAAVAHLLSIISIVAIGALLVEYMTDGTIYNKAFNILCVITVVLVAILLVSSLTRMFLVGKSHAILAVLYTFSRLAMVFLFAFYAYDAAKHQLKREKVS